MLSVLNTLLNSQKLLLFKSLKSFIYSESDKDAIHTCLTDIKKRTKYVEVAYEDYWNTMEIQLHCCYCFNTKQFLYLDNYYENLNVLKFVHFIGFRGIFAIIY